MTTKNFRDGVSQRNRLLRALEPDYVSVDEQSWSDLLKFAQKYSQQLKYYDESNQENGNWSSFFEGDVEQMVAYINNPESFETGDHTKLNRLSQPHLVLFFTFLQLLRYPQQQFRELTPRYVNFYYKDVLKLTEKESIPDRVHLILGLESGETSHLVPQGTLLDAGQDSQGIELNYAIDEDIVLNQAQVASIKTLSMEKKYIDLRSIHNSNDRSDLDFEAVLRWAFGSPKRGDELPEFNDTAVDISYLNNLYQEIKEQDIAEIAEDRKDYILQQLFFATIEDFKYCLEIHYREINQDGAGIQPPTELQWNQVYQLIEKANRKKINRQRRDVLKQEQENYGFQEMLNFALGSPNPGDSLPRIPNKDDHDLPIDILANNQSDENELDAAVVEYINEELCMSVEDLRTIILTKEKADSTEAQWSEVYRLMEKAQTRKRNFTYPPLSTQEIVNIYETSIVDAQGEETAEFKQFKTFTTTPQNQKTTLGLAIASPLLFLKEGHRVITITLACEEGTLDLNAIAEIDQAIKPFSVHLSSPEQWLELSYTALEFGAGDFILQPPLRTYTTEEISKSDTSTWFDLASPSNQPFSDGDINNFIVWNDGEVYRITRYINDHRVVVETAGRLALDTANSQVNLYHSSAISLNSLQFEITLNDQQPAIAPLLLDESNVAIDTPYPMVKILLKDVLREDSYEETVICYQQFRSIRLKKATIQIDVQDIQELNLRNDNSLLDTNSPFEIFGNSPKVGTGFYFANPEISRKKLDSLTLHLDWMQLPNDFATHYQAYSEIGIFNNAIANDSFKGQLKLLNNRSWQNIDAPKSLFTETGTTLTNPLQLDYPNLDLFGYLPNPDTEEIDLEDPFDYPRYFKLELESPNFGQEIYPIVLTKVALATDEAIRNLTVYPPYTPEVKSISLDYTASVEINLTITFNKTPVNQVFQLNTFGYRNLQHPDNRQEGDRGYYFLPQYNQQGALYIGIRNLQPPENLSFLFQMMPGGANTDLAKPDIHWSYLNGDRWQDFTESQILSDTTTGLVDAGIIRFRIPETATQKNHLLPTGLHWLRATVTENATAIPDILNIKTQAVSATFVNQGNAEDHLSKNLPADSIQALVTRDPAIEQVLQPYSSFGGRSTENSRAFNTRISERLRHKHRAITSWDYERLVLEQFPEIYKVKCVTSELGSTNPCEAKVTVVVIPDIANTAPFYPLEPKAPLYLLKKIEAYLKSRTSPFINLVVKNPRYEKIKYRVVVRLRPGYEQGYYLQQLNEDLKRFLSPWAYEGQADITFGSSIHSSSVVHFLDKRPYVDYVTNLKLIEQVVLESNYSGEYDVSYQVNESQIAQVHHPDSILVSASEHIIDLVTTDQYEEENFEGIGYMIMGIDFVVT